MAETLSLMEFLQALMADAGLRGDFGQDPQGTLAAHGLADLTPADVHDALVLVQDNQTVEYSLDPAAAPPPPPPAGGNEAAVEYLAHYLAGPHGTADDEQWADVDPDLGPDAAVAPARFVPDDAPLLPPDPADDHGYGAGAASLSHGATEEPGGYDVDDLGTDDGGYGYDLGRYDLDADDLDADDLDADALDADDLGGAEQTASDSPDEPGAEDPETSLPGL